MESICEIVELVENAVFGPNVVQSVLTGGNYMRTFKGIMLLGESLKRLLWIEFFKHSDMKECEAKSYRPCELAEEPRSSR